MTLPAVSESVTYRAMHEHGGDLHATVRAHHRGGGLDLEVHIPGATDPLTLTNIKFSADAARCPRGACFIRESQPKPQA